MPGLGVIVNAISVIIGSLVGVTAGGAIPEVMRDGVVKAVGLSVLAIGLAGALFGLAEVGTYDGVLGSYSALVFVGSLVLGIVVGELLRIEHYLERFGHVLNNLVDRLKSPRAQDSALGVVADETTDADIREHSLVEGFVTATLLFCVGSMTFLGSIQDGLGNPSTLYLKGLLDGVISIFLATTLGIGVAISALSILIMQGAIAAIAFSFGDIIPAESIVMLEMVGGALIAAIGLDLLGIKRLPVGNMVPAVFIAMAAGWLLA